jgi:hypothetical protein
MGLEAYIDVMFYKGNPDFYEKYIKIIETTVLSLKGIFDIFMHILFITIFIYFLRLKNARRAQL